VSHGVPVDLTSPGRATHAIAHRANEIKRPACHQPPDGRQDHDRGQVEAAEVSGSLPRKRQFAGLRVSRCRARNDDKSRHGGCHEVSSVLRRRQHRVLRHGIPSKVRALRAKSSGRVCRSLKPTRPTSRRPSTFRRTISRAARSRSIRWTGPTRALRLGSPNGHIRSVPAATPCPRALRRIGRAGVAIPPDTI
jgi:hypothetical protein